MAYLTELDVDEYGSLSGDEMYFPVEVVAHDWNSPYPPVEPVVPFEWRRGGAGGRPNVFWYPQMREWVCDEKAHRLLLDLAAPDIHTFARGRLGEQSLFVVQVVGVLDIVDRENSIIDRYPSYEILQFPSFYRTAADAASTRIFRVPGAPTKIFVGEAVKQALDTSDIHGLLFTPVGWSD